MKYSEPTITESGKIKKSTAKPRFINGPLKDEIISALQEREVDFPMEAEIPKGRTSIDKTEALKKIYEAICADSCNKALTKEQNKN